MFKNILVPTDGSKRSMATTNKAVKFAKSIGAHLVFFYAKPEPRVELYGEAMLADPQARANYARMTEEHAQNVLSTCSSVAQAGGVAATAVTISTSAVFEAILATAKANSCDLIFMASHGQRGDAALLLGSETQKVLTYSTIPVLVYR